MTGALAAFLAQAVTRRARSDDDRERERFNVHDRRFADRLQVHAARTEADRWSRVVRIDRG